MNLSRYFFFALMSLILHGIAANTASSMLSTKITAKTGQNVHPSLVNLSFVNLTTVPNQHKTNLKKSIHHKKKQLSSKLIHKKSTLIPAKKIHKKLHNKKTKEKNILSQVKIKTFKPKKIKRNQTHSSLPKLVQQFHLSTNTKPIHYPRLAKRQGIEGDVLIEIWLDKKGEIIKHVILHSSGHPILDNAALRAIKKWHFSPFLEQEVAIIHRVHIPIQFRLTH